MHIRDTMTEIVVQVGPEHTLAQAAAKMAERNVGSAVVLEPDGYGPGIFTERDLLRAVAAGEDPTTTTIAGHHADELTVAQPDWTLEQAASAMMRGGFRHLVVVEGGDVVGIVSMRDIVRAWVGERKHAM